MKILHICICGPFTDGLTYQENELINHHAALNHDVVIIASTSTYDSEKKITHTSPGFYKLSNGAKLIRLQHIFGLNNWLGSKIRAHKYLKQNIEEIEPDIILFHGLSAWDLLVTAKYVSSRSTVKLYADCHEDFYNSARTWLSRELLHKRFYRPIFRHSLKYIHEVLCVTIESIDFAINFYGSDKSKTRIYPLGSSMESDEVRLIRRQNFRLKYNINHDDLAIVQTGKLDASKKLEEALLKFVKTRNSNLKFFIAGHMSPDVLKSCSDIIASDPRIINLGWQNSDQLKDIFSGVDFFIQPFGQTASTQFAMGYGCIILAQDVPSHRWLIGDKGKLFKDVNELDDVFRWILDPRTDINYLRRQTIEFAKSHLDYRVLACQLTN